MVVPNNIPRIDVFPPNDVDLPPPVAIQVQANPNLPESLFTLSEMVFGHYQVGSIPETLMSYYDENLNLRMDPITSFHALRALTLVIRSLMFS